MILFLKRDIPLAITIKFIHFMSYTIASDMAEIGYLIIDVPTKTPMTIYQIKGYHRKG
jgi:hypothetical protein